ncbi:ankyrin repeat-containing protein [Tritrichomonas foetus]|uniref:Ankyrin repeat-containing protein n=1 Tax=Tritrichomonas foetus TaxID=1144522 RepID=A0A1J4KMS7_9EUKA|nr:ankyrin repeat-containing protein [Tritrichomonas foetus]|eukprot:OHT12418.1 ankyrin repeat-containing protein [Tritrichomonas foetus]
MTNIDLPPYTQSKAAVHWICTSCNPEIARIILAKGIDVNRLDHDGHMGPFYMLDVGEEDEIIEVLELLLQAGLDVNKKTPTTSSILGEFVSSITKPLKIIEWLLAHGASMNSKLTTGQTIFEFMKQTPDLHALAKRYSLIQQNNRPL